MSSACLGQYEVSRLNHMQSSIPQKLLRFIVLIFLSLLVGCSGNLGGGDTGEQVKIATTPTNFERLSAERGKNGVSKAYALEQFVAHFGELENAPEYTYDGSMPIFASHAIADVLTYEDELEPAVLAEIIDRILPGKPDVNNRELDSTVITQLGAMRVNTIDEELQATVREIAVDLGNRFNRPLRRNIEVARATTDHFGFDKPQIGTAYNLPLQGRLGAYGKTIDDVVFESEANCWLVINEDKEAIAPFDGLSEKEKRMILAHEITHCFQHEIMFVERIPKAGWIIEGTATWVGEAYVGGTDYFSNVWPVYEKPIFNLFNRVYSAMGFWSHVAETPGVDLWSSLPTFYDNVSVDTNENLNAVIDLIGEESYSTWPTGRARQPSWGSAWNSVGVGGRTESAIRLNYEDKKNEIPAGETQFLLLQPKEIESRPTILQIETNSIGRIRFGRLATEVELIGPDTGFQTVNICVSPEECVCENGTFLEGFSENVLDARDGQSLTIAIASADSDTTFNHDYIDVLASCERGTLLPEQPREKDKDACMVGSWNVDLAEVNRSLGGRAVFDGSQVLTLNANGIGVETIAMTNTRTVVVGGKNQVIIQKTNGTIEFQWFTDRGNYVVEDEKYNLRVTSTSIIDGEAGPETTVPVSELGQQINKRRYQCSNNQLLLSFPGVDIPDLRYTR